MSNFVQFISESDLKGITVIQQNVDPYLLVPFIKVAQEINIEQFLGIALTTTLKDGIQNNNLSPANQTLLDEYIKPSLAFYTFYEALPFLNSKVTNKGIVLKSSDNSTNVSDATLGGLRSQTKNYAEYYKNRMENFLCDNKANYPTWKSDKVSINTRNFDSGIYFPTKNRNKSEWL
jgi:hypothetical protein